jgi:hypothetical protein
MITANKIEYNIIDAKKLLSEVNFNIKYNTTEDLTTLKKYFRLRDTLTMLIDTLEDLK